MTRIRLAVIAVVVALVVAGFATDFFQAQAWLVAGYKKQTVEGRIKTVQDQVKAQEAASKAQAAEVQRLKDELEKAKAGGS